MKIKIDMTGIDLLPSGSYRVRVQVKGESLTDTVLGLDEALLVRDRLRRQGRSRNFVKPGEVTMQTWGATWLKECRADKDINSERGRLERHIVTHEIATKPLRLVTPDDVFLWARSLEKKLSYDGVDNCGERDPAYLSFSSRKHCVDLIRALFADAKSPSYAYCTFNPAADFRLVKGKAELAKQKVSVDWPLKANEIDYHLGSFGKLDERWISQAAIGTAMRQGEQWRLRIPDVHLGGSEPYIFIREGKTPESCRRILLFGLGLEAFERWIEILGRYAPRNPDRLVFPTRVRMKASGEYYARGGNERPEGAPPFFKKLRQLPTRPDPIWWHLYRHTCATALLSGTWGHKWSIEEVSKFLGHTSTKTTEMYAHFLDSALGEVVQETQAAWTRKKKAEARKKLRLVV